MSREYVLSGANLTLAGAVTVLAFRPGTTCAIEVLRMGLSQSSSATSAMQRVQVVSQAATLPTVVSATPVRVKEGDPVSAIVGGTALAAGTCGVNASAEGGGTRTVLFEDAFDILNGWLWVPTPKETIIRSPGSASSFGIYLPAAPGTLTGWNAFLVYREVG